MAILVDCTQRGAHADLQQRYNVDGFPTIVFLSPEGERLEELRSRDAAAVREQILSVSQRFQRTLLVEATLEDGLATAREARKLLVVAFVDGDLDAPANAPLLEALQHPSVRPFHEQLTWIRRPVRQDRRQTEEARGFHVAQSPTLLVLDPFAEGEQDRVLERISSWRRVQGALERAVREASERGHPPPG